MKHPDVVAYARFLDLPDAQRVAVERHLQLCGECRDLVLFVRKTITTLGNDGLVAKVAQALNMDVEELKRHMDLGTSIGKLIAERSLSEQTLPLTPSGRVDHRAFAGRFVTTQSRTKIKTTSESTQSAQVKPKTDQAKRNEAEARGIEVERPLSKVKDLATRK